MSLVDFLLIIVTYLPGKLTDIKVVERDEGVQPQIFKMSVFSVLGHPTALCFGCLGWFDLQP